MCVLGRGGGRGGVNEGKRVVCVFVGGWMREGILILGKLLKR